MLHILVKQETNIDLANADDMKLVRERPDIEQRVYYAANRPSTIELLDVLCEFAAQYGDQRERVILEKLRAYEADDIQTMAIGLAMMIDERIAELEAKKVKGE